MNVRLLLVKAITLLYRESTRESSSLSTSLVKDLLEVIKKPDNAMNGDFGRDPVTALYDILLEIMGEGDSPNLDVNDLVYRCRIACGNDSALFGSLQGGLTDDLDDDAVAKLIASNTKSLQTAIHEATIKTLFKDYYILTNHKTNEVDWRHIVGQFIEKLEPLSNGVRSDNEPHPGFVGEVDFNNVSSIKDILISAREEMSTDGTIQSGFQGLNRAYGEELGGLRRGEYVVVSALQHNYKSGFVLDIYRHAAQYNVPYLLDPEKTPTLVRVSFENSTNTDTVLLYRRLYEQEFNVPVDMNDPNLDFDDVSTYVSGKLGANGYKCLMYQFDPSNYTYSDLFALIEKLERSGHEIHMLNIDYVGMMSKAGCVHGPHGTEYRDLFRRIRNFCLKKKITCVTPAQMSTEAKRLLRNGVEQFLKKVANKGYYDSCSTLDQEVDLEIYLHIVKYNNASYLEVQLGKHRKTNVTPDKDKNFVYKFNAIGDILDDIHGKDMSLNSVGGASQEEGGGPAWYDNM